MRALLTSILARRGADLPETGGHPSHRARSRGPGSLESLFGRGAYANVVALPVRERENPPDGERPVVFLVSVENFS